ncbi:MAG: LemA family protein [Spirochaetales bacterium]|nr:LemA family protein [Spirochaetales bacterium]MBQ2258974.1 LemA family protein [Spirochaetales bacterium]
MTIIIVLLIIVVIAAALIGIYNSLVRLKNKAEEAEAGIDAHLKQRYDLIPNLVETVKGYAKHESSTLEAVIQARLSAMTATTTEAKDEANNVLSGTLKSLFALSESYPDLKANTNFLNLQDKLTGIESELLSARKYYNAVARTFNDKAMVFPSSIVASMFHFKKLSYVQIESEARENVKVQF